MIDFIVALTRKSLFIFSVKSIKQLEIIQIENNLVKSVDRPHHLCFLPRRCFAGEDSLTEDFFGTVVLCTGSATLLILSLKQVEGRFSMFHQTTKVLSEPIVTISYSGWLF